MPWECIQVGSQWKCVEKGNPDNVKGSHPDKPSCEKQLRALYANYKEDKNA